MAIHRSKNTQAIFVGKNNCTVIIPAAGLGRRLKYQEEPKSLIKLTEQYNVLSYQIKLIEDVIKPKEILLITGFGGDKIYAHSPQRISKIQNDKFETTNVLRSIGIGLRAATTDRIMILYGDLVCNRATIRPGIFDKSTMVVSNNNPLLKKDEVGCTINDEGQVENVFYGLENKWAQILYLTGKELKLFRDLAFDPKYEKCFGFEAINLVIEAGGVFSTHHPNGCKFIDIDVHEDIRVAQNLAKESLSK